jgi:FAD:protein FMN transferase
VHRLMSFHDPESDVSRLNRSAHRGPVAVHPWTWHVLKAGVEFSSHSGGAFDFTIAPLLQRWRYLPGRHSGSGGGGWNDVCLGEDCTVRFGRPLALDLGGIAKGHAVDLAVAALRDAGVPQGLVNAGGDLRVFGENTREVHIRHPLAPGSSAGVITLAEKSAATSAVYFSRRGSGCRTRSPLVHGRTRRPCVDDFSATVIAGDCLVADALTKIVAALRDEAAHILAAFGAEAIVIERDAGPRFIRGGHAP